MVSSSVATTSGEWQYCTAILCAAVEAAIARSLERFRTAGTFESADLVRADRDTHQ